MTNIVDFYDAQLELSSLLDRVAAGEEIIISKAGRPIAKLVLVGPLCPRRPGFVEGHVGDGFFEPLPDKDLDAWEGR
jgi:antitoxin (DNA-binding transcriptional repressor) of toxin-antitoxin stability system